MKLIIAAQAIIRVLPRKQLFVLFNNKKYFFILFNKSNSLNVLNFSFHNYYLMIH
jgi:hypothetical protein